MTVDRSFYNYYIILFISSTFWCCCSHLLICLCDAFVNLNNINPGLSPPPPPSSLTFPNDTHTLLRFKATAAAAGSAGYGGLSSWNTSDCCATNPSTWVGVRCGGGGGGGDRRRRVWKLSLKGMQLRGSSIQALTYLTELRVLSLPENQLEGGIPIPIPIPKTLEVEGEGEGEVGKGWSRLCLLDLSSNNLSGGIPDAITSLTRLRRLDLSRNALTGPIPPHIINSLTRLVTLDLHHNALTGPLPPFLSLPTLLLKHLRLSYNNLSGQLSPQLLRRFPLSSFIGNPNLCLPPASSSSSSSSSCNSIGNANASQSSRSSSRSSGGVVSSNPSAPMYSSYDDIPPSSTTPSYSGRGGGGPPKHNPNKLSFGVIVAIVTGDMVVILFLALTFLLYYWKKVKLLGDYCGGGGGGEEDGSRQSSPTLKTGSHHLPTTFQSGYQDDGEKRSTLVFLDAIGAYPCKRFKLEDLLRSSAEMLGKGSFGTTYKAVLGDGYSVAVKRLKDAVLVDDVHHQHCRYNTTTTTTTTTTHDDDDDDYGGGSRTVLELFEQCIEIVGKLNDHPNIVPLRAYYCAKDEKLLIYDFMPNGNLFSLLHGNRGMDGAEVNWVRRVKIALGVARALAHIHEVGKVPHGNIRSSNVLLDKDGNARVGDSFLTRLINPSLVSSRLVGYRAPESNNKDSLGFITHQEDIYSFGVLLLEILTGKAPTQSLHDGVDLPKWVQSVIKEGSIDQVFDDELVHYINFKEQMVSLLQIAMACASLSPFERPKMSQVLKVIEDMVRPDHHMPLVSDPCSGLERGGISGQQEKKQRQCSFNNGLTF